MYGPPQHAWGQMAPDASEQQAHDRVECIEKTKQMHGSLSSNNTTVLHFLKGSLLKPNFTVTLSCDQYKALVRR